MALYLVRVSYTTLNSNEIRLDLGYASVKWSIEANAFPHRNNGAACCLLLAIKLPFIDFISFFHLNLKIEPFLFVLPTLYRQMFLSEQIPTFIFFA